MQQLFSFTTLLALAAFFMTSCQQSPIEPEARVTVSNTLQTAADPSAGGTGGTELPIEAIFGAPDGTYVLSATVNDNVEFPDYLEGLYDIDLSEKEIQYTLVADANDPIYSVFFRTLESGTFDRYYFEFDNPHNIESGIANNGSVSLRVISETEIVVEISEGFSFNPGTTFTITLN